MAVIVVVLLRKEVASVLSAPKDDRAVETLLGEMNRQFAANMEMFHVTNGYLGGMKEVFMEILQIQRQILTELVRRQ